MTPNEEHFLEAVRNEASEESGEHRKVRDPRPWPYAVGTKGVNRVRVYNRDDSGVIQIEWVDDRGRQQRSLRTVVGEPVTDRTLARDIADRMSAKQAEVRNQAARRLVFGTDATVKDLLDELHRRREPKWKKTYRRDQGRYKAFWTEKLGARTHIKAVSADRVEAVVEEEAGRRGWSPRTQAAYLRYIVDAYYFAEKKLNLLLPTETLSAVDFPRLSKRRGKAYSAVETKALLPTLMEVDLRAGVVGQAYYQAGRRLNSTRLLEVGHVSFDTLTTEDREEVEAVVFHYPPEQDKVGSEETEAVLVGSVVRKVRELLRKPAVQATGLLMPHGELDDPKAKRKPIRKENLIHMLHEAESLAEVEHVSGRAYHGLKRRWAGSTTDRETARRQSGTSVATQRDTYDPQDDRAGKAGFALDLVKRLEGE